MARIHFNGISNLSFDGTVFSFVVDDTYQLSDGKIQKIIAAELATDLKSIEGICKYLLGEVEKIKALQSEKKPTEVEALDTPQEVGSTLQLGKKISSSNDPHG